MKEHECLDFCRLDEGHQLWRIPPRYMRWWLPVGRLRHVCGPWCSQVDPPTPVRLDWRGEDRYDRTPVRQPCGHRVAPGITHRCKETR